MRNNDSARVKITLSIHEENGPQSLAPPLKPETTSRLNAIQEALASTPAEVEYHFDLTVNNVELTVRDYVFDSSEYNLRLLLSLVDDFVFDALIDGKVNLELIIRNAFEEEEE